VKVIHVLRKPLGGTVAANVLEHGTGALNVEATRIGVEGGTRREGKATQPTAAGWANMRGHGITQISGGRWPANLILQHCRCVSTKVVDAWECVPECPTLAVGDGATYFKQVGH